MTIYNPNRALILCIAIFICICCKSQQKPGNLFKVDPSLYDNGPYRYFVFPFNDTFIMANKIKTITYGKPSNKHINEFDRNGHLIKTYLLQTKKQSKKADTLELEERIYNPVTGLLDTLIEFHESYIPNDPFLTDATVSCYHYDNQNRLEKILRFDIFSIEPAEPKNENPTDYDTESMILPISESEKKLEPVNKSGIRGRPVDTAAFNIMKRNNDFSSTRYKYYMKDRTVVQEQTELNDFSKIYGHNDTCEKQTVYYSYNNRFYLKFNQYECKENDIPSEYYRYKNGLLDSMVQVFKYRPDIHFMYDSRNNLTHILGVKKGEYISVVKMTYDERGILKTIQRRPTRDMDDWYMVDDTLVFETAFF